MSNVEAAATATETAADEKFKVMFKVMVTMSEQEHNDLQDLRAELRKLGVEKKIPSTAAVASRVFKQGLAVVKTELKEVKKNKKPS